MQTLENQLPPPQVNKRSNFWLEITDNDSQKYGLLTVETGVIYIYEFKVSNNNGEFHLRGKIVSDKIPSIHPCFTRVNKNLGNKVFLSFNN